MLTDIVFKDSKTLTLENTNNERNSIDLLVMGAKGMGLEEHLNIDPEFQKFSAARFQLYKSYYVKNQKDILMLPELERRSFLTELQSLKDQYGEAVEKWVDNEREMKLNIIRGIYDIHIKPAKLRLGFYLNKELRQSMKSGYCLSHYLVTYDAPSSGLVADDPNHISSGIVDNVQQVLDKNNLLVDDTKKEYVISYFKLSKTRLIEYKHIPYQGDLDIDSKQFDIETTPLYLYDFIEVVRKWA